MSYQLTLQDIHNTIRDFATFCKYIEAKKPCLTPARNELGKKECFELDRLLSHPKRLAAPKYLQDAYPSINLWFHLALAIGLFSVEQGKRASRVLIPTQRLELFRNLNPFSQYFCLFRVFWTVLSWDELYQGTTAMIDHFLYTEIGFHGLKNAQPGQRLEVDIENIQNMDRADPLRWMYIKVGPVIHHLRDFGFCEYERIFCKYYHVGEREIHVKAVTPTRAGIAMINACLARPLEIYNPYIDTEQIRDAWRQEHLQPVLEKLKLNTPRPAMKIQPFETVFVPLFPEGALDQKNFSPMFSEISDEPAGDRPANVYRLKVSLATDCFRVIDVAAAHTLQHLHEAIMEAFGFGDDHFFAFFMDGKPWSKNVFWDKRSGHKPTADKAVIAELGWAAGMQFLYIFDFGDEWYFTIQVEKPMAAVAAPLKPIIVECFGTAPDQYPFEDE